MSQAAINRHLIIEAITKYAWGFDENNFNLVAGAFAQEATSRGKVAGTDIAWGPMNGRDQIVSTFQEIRNGQTDRRRHCLSNFLFVDQKAMEARVQCYMVLVSANDGKLTIVTSGTFDVDVTKTGAGEWLLTRLDIELDAPF